MVESDHEELVKKVLSYLRRELENDKSKLSRQMNEIYDYEKTKDYLNDFLELKDLNMS